MTSYIIQSFKVIPNVKENGRRSIIKVGVYCENTRGPVHGWDPSV